MILLITFVAVLALTLIILALFARPPVSNKILQQRLRTIQTASRAQGPDSGLIELSKAEKPSAGDHLDGFLQRYEFAGKLQLLIVHAGSTMTVGSLMVRSAGLALVCGFLGYIFIPVPALNAGVVLVGAALPLAALKVKRSRRLNAFSAALPDAIDLMTRALRAGHSMSSSLELIAEQCPDPLGAEFFQVFQQQKFGIPFRDALLQIVDRVPSKDLRFLVTAILVQKETGGDLTEILDRTTHVIRERVRIEGEVKVYTAQGRLTGWILGLLPVIMLGLINIVSPGYSYALFHDPIGQKMLYGGGILIIIGGLIIRKIVDIQV